MRESGGTQCGPDPASPLLFHTNTLLPVKLLNSKSIPTSLSSDLRPPTSDSNWDGNEHPVTILVPVLNEAARLAPCLTGLSAQGPEVNEILVVDGGSTDATHQIVERFAARDPRIRWLVSPPAPPGSNGKAHNLVHGLAHADLASEWILTIDADVRPQAGLAAALLHHAARKAIPALSVATGQQLSSAGEALLHPAMLTTLVYRFGIPGHAVIDPAQVQANGQCFLVHREALATAGGFSQVTDSICEDVTLARLLAAAGYPVGFYETDGDLVSVAMYAGAADAWRNWLRSLPMRDRFWNRASWLGMAEMTLIQAAPLPLALILRGRTGLAGMLGRLNLVLLMIRLGVLAGTARAYRSRPWTYWLSPLSDVPVAIGVLLSAMRRVHSWRGRPITRGAPR